jgi:hypothetical protein
MQEAIDGSSFRSSSIVRPSRLLQSKQDTETEDTALVSKRRI